jgi:CheY-like chemotaxis protein
VHCVERFPKDTPVQVTCTLPTGDTIRLEARVVFSGGHGMGLQWRLDPLAEQELAEVVARVASRPRRALLVDDDALFRRILSDALQERGFDVIEAADGVAALEVLSEELLSLDLLLADLRMPRMDGQALLRTVRSAGGESELAIVVVSAWIEGGLELKLQREGADAVLQKELGAAFIAQAANAVLERKRAARQA